MAERGGTSSRCMTRRLEGDVTMDEASEVLGAMPWWMGTRRLEGDNTAVAAPTDHCWVTRRRRVVRPAGMVEE
jgi:hypothetical protein